MKSRATRIKIATGKPVAVMRNMKVGETIRFPFEAYKYNTIRAIPSGPLAHDRHLGKRWRTHVNYIGGYTDVTRVS